MENIRRGKIVSTAGPGSLWVCVIVAYCKCREREILSIPFFLQFSLCSSLARSFEPFHYYYLIFLSFQFSALKPDHPFQVDLQIRPRNQTTTVHQFVRSTPHQTTTTDLMGPQIRSPNPSTIPDHQTQPFAKSDYQSRLPPPHQPTKLDQPSRLSSLPTQLQISTAHPASWSSTGQVHSLWVGTRGYIELWMNLAKHTIHTLSA